MERKLFLTELHRALGAQVAIVGAVLAVLLSFAYLLPDAVEEASGFLLFLTVVSGFAMGGRGFFQQFQDHHLPLLQVLPIPRATAWGLLVAANAAATLPTYVLLVLLARTSTTSWPSGLLVVLYFQAFCGGCCMIGTYPSLAGDGRVVNSLMELPAVVVVWTAMVSPWVLALYVGVPADAYPFAVGRHMLDFFELVDLRFLVGGSLLLAIGTLALARDYFLFGETRLRSTRWRNTIRAAILSALFVVIAMSIASTGMSSLGDEWVVAGYAVSRDGRSIAFVEFASRHPKISRVLVREIGSSDVPREIQRNGLRDLWWTADSNLRVLSRDTLVPPFGYFIREADRLETFSPDLEPMGLVVDKQIALVERKGLVGEVAVLVDGSSMRLATLPSDERDGWDREVSVSAPIEAGFTMYRQRIGDLLLLRLSSATESRFWLVDSELRQLEWAGSVAGRRYVVDDIVYDSATRVHEQLSKVFPSAPDGMDGGRGAFLTTVWPSRTLTLRYDSLPQLAGVYRSSNDAFGTMVYVHVEQPPFYLTADLAGDLGSLFAFDRVNLRWESVVVDVPLGEGANRFVFARDIGTPIRRALGIFDVDQQLGLATYAVETADGFELFVFDANRMRSVSLGVIPGSDGRYSVTMGRVEGFDGSVVSFFHESDTDGRQIDLAFAYSTSSGNFMELPTGENPLRYLYIGDDGTVIYQEIQAASIRIMRRLSGQAPTVILVRPRT